MVNLKSWYLFGIIKASNKLLKLRQEQFEYIKDDCGVEKSTLKSIIPGYCEDVNSNFRDCSFCDINDTSHEYDNWCTCRLLVYLNKSIFNLWRNDNEL